MDKTKNRPVSVSRFQRPHPKKEDASATIYERCECDPILSPRCRCCCYCIAVAVAVVVVVVVVAAEITMSQTNSQHPQAPPEPIVSIENVDFVERDRDLHQNGGHQRQSSRAASSFSGDEGGAGGTSTPNHYYAYPPEQQAYANVSMTSEQYAAAAAAAYYGQALAQAQAYFAQQQQQGQNQGQQQPHGQQQYYNAPPYGGYAQPYPPQVYDYGGQPGYEFPQQQQQQQQQQQHRRSQSTNSHIPTHSRKSGDPGHPLKQNSNFAGPVWSNQAAGQEYESLLHDSTGYGTIPTSSRRGAGGGVVSAGASAGSSGSVGAGWANAGFGNWEQSTAAVLNRTKPKAVAAAAGGGAGPALALKRQRRPKEVKSHRRASSDTPLRHMQRDRENKIPPKSKGVISRRVMPKASASTQSTSAAAALNRQRSFSASQTDAANRERTFSGSALAPLGVKRPSHKRSTSLSSVGSDASQFSIVSDIRKSAFYGGINEKGEAQMHYPFENVYLAVVDKLKPKGMKNWHLYMANTDVRAYEEYHRAAEEMDLDANWNMDNPSACNCPCNNCNRCTGKKDLLPPNVYAMAVDEGLYRRVLDEIGASRSMPCGLFFCGHHEDVSHPSIGIAIVIVTLTFLGLGAAAYQLH